MNRPEPSRKMERERMMATVAPERTKTVLPDLNENASDRRDPQESVVIVYDNDSNTFEQVTWILMQATDCTLEEAEIETWEVHHLGKSVVHHGPRGECERAANIIRTIGIRVEVTDT